MYIVMQVVRVSGNLKLRLSTSKITTESGVEFIEPSVVGFIGECHVVKHVSSILESSSPCSSVTMNRSLDLKRVIAIEPR